jgi:hypothetical protein
MNISFPISNYAQAFNILSEIFEAELQTESDNFSFQWDGNRITCSQLNCSSKFDTLGLVIELYHLQHSCFEIEKRLELYCYKNHIVLSDIGIKLDRYKQNLEWTISPLVTLQICFLPTSEITLS